MSKLANVERFFKNVNLTSDYEVFVGVDVHKKSYHVALFLNDTPANSSRFWRVNLQAARQWMSEQSMSLS